MTERRTIDVTEVIEQQKLTGFAVRLVLLSWIITFFDGFDVAALSYAWPDMWPALHLNKLSLGYVYGAGQVGMVLGGFLFGYLGDRIGRRLSIILATTGFGVFAFAMAAAGSYDALVVLRFFEGAAMGGLLPLAWALNVEFVPRRFRATVVTSIMVGYSIGSGSAGPLTLWLVPHHGWRSVFLAGGIAAFVGTALLVFFLPESLRFLTIERRHPELIAAYARQLAPGRAITAEDDFVLSDEIAAAERKFSVRMLFYGELRWITPLLWLAYAATSLAVFFGSSWGPSVLLLIGYARSTASLTASLTTLGGAAGGLLLMRFLDKRGASTIAVFPVIAIPILLLMGSAAISGRAFLVLYFFGTMCLIGAHYGMMSIGGIFYPSAFRSNGTGWMASVGKLGSIAGPVLGGVALARMPAKHVFAILSVFPLVVALCATIIGRFQRRIPHRVEAEGPTGELLESEIPARH
jgi:AAHS family 4-hydroxybenzoate transporter-like MFS transporter